MLIHYFINLKIPIFIIYFNYMIKYKNNIMKDSKKFTHKTLATLNY